MEDYQEKVAGMIKRAQGYINELKGYNQENPPTLQKIQEIREFHRNLVLVKDNVMTAALSSQLEMLVGELQQTTEQFGLRLPKTIDLELDQQFERSGVCRRAQNRV
jgi:hypothetical protein